MTNYIKTSIKKYLNDLSSNLPAPGGGSACALAGAIGVACLLMVANFTLNKKGYEKHQSKIKKIIGKLQMIKKELLELVNEDVKAYRKVANAYRLPKTTEEEIKKRKKEIQKSLVCALAIPKKILLKCIEAQQKAETLSVIGNKNLLTDVGCGIYFLNSSAEGAKLNVEINLKFIDNGKLVVNVKKEIEKDLIKLKTLYKKINKKINTEMRK